MEELAGRFAALDPEAAEALKVIGYFDSLVAGHVGLESLVRGAAVLTGITAGMADPDRRLAVRVMPDGRSVAAEGDADPSWLTMAVAEGESARAWLETTTYRALDTLVLERLVAGVRVVLDRTRGRVVRDDAAALEVLVDPTTSLDHRARTARRLGWSAEAVVRAVALEAPGDPGRGSTTHGIAMRLEPADRAHLTAAGPTRPAGRVGVGSAVPVLEAGRSWREALVALRFAADGTGDDPGDTTITYAALGGLALLADAVGRATPVHPDVSDLERLARTHPWALTTLDLVASSASLRAASTGGHVHHSTMQARVAQLEHDLGWGGALTDPATRLRLQVALALRRLHRHP